MKLLPIKNGAGIKCIPKEDRLVSNYFLFHQLSFFCAETTKKDLYRKNGKLIEEKVGGQFKDNMTPAKASSIRGLRIEGSIPTNNEKRERIRQEKLKEKSSYSFIRLFSLFEESERENRSLKDDRIRFSLHIAPLIGKKAISELTTQDIEKIRRKMEKEGKSPQTVKHVLTLIKRLVNYALKNGYIESVPATLHFDMPAVDNKVTENLTAKQVAKLCRFLTRKKILSWHPLSVLHCLQVCEEVPC